MPCSGRPCTCCTALPLMVRTACNWSRRLYNCLPSCSHSAPGLLAAKANVNVHCLLEDAAAVSAGRVMLNSTRCLQATVERVQLNSCQPQSVVPKQAVGRSQCWRSGGCDAIRYSRASIIGICNDLSVCLVESNACAFACGSATHPTSSAELTFRSQLLAASGHPSCRACNLK
jgi:hypothetical protein